MKLTALPDTVYVISEAVSAAWMMPTKINSTWKKTQYNWISLKQLNN